MGLTSKPLAGPGYVVLNILRIMNIIALIMVIVASWVMLVKTFVVSKFFFFDAVSHLVTSVVGLFLITSEIQLFKSYFAKNWPLLSPSSGLVTLGVIMVVLGVSTLGNLNKEATSQASLGTSFWRIVISAGILVAILGLLNIILSFIFRDRDLGITARQVRSKGAVAATTPKLLSTSGSIHRSYSYNNASTAERQASVRSARNHHHQHDMNESRQPVGPRLPINISAPINFNHQFDDYVVPVPPNSHPARSMSVTRPAETHQPGVGGYWEKI
ncbi:MAG: hypothetical protein M1823_000582 [Watsoniomyces obsoletus]|nr:MAG: hypothetical protein M1823_000582 [Watsoniomyces obsoletus]